jgi:hypothetical protein
MGGQLRIVIRQEEIVLLSGHLFVLTEITANSHQDISFPGPD